MIPTPVTTAPPPLVVVQGPATYTDSRYGHSFNIPAGFFVQSEPQGGYGSVTNYDPRGITGFGDVREDAMKVEVVVIAEVKERSVDEWLTAHSDDDVLSTAPFVLDGISGVQRIVASSWGIEGTGIGYAVKRGNEIYLVAVHYAYSGQVSTVSEMLGSFRFGQ